jgi:aminoglycoside phosphotransferase (APT) family kinase protein
MTDSLHPVDTRDEPFLTGRFAPVSDEIAVDRLAVEGTVPTDLTGAYLRNGPNPRFTPLGSYTYPLEGDGMVHGVWLDGGQARYANRYVRTQGMLAEERAGRALYGGIMTPAFVDQALLGDDPDPGWPFKPRADATMPDRAGGGAGEASPLGRAVAALRDHGLGRQAAPRPLGSGLDNAAFVAGEHIVRVAQDAGAGLGVDREAGLLAVVGAAGLGIAVPEPVFVDGVRGVVCYRRLPGEPLLGRDAPPTAAVSIGRALRRLHAVDTAVVDGLVPREPGVAADWADALAGPRDLVDAVRADVPAAHTREVLGHNDLGAEHLLADGSGLTGIIDWSDAALTDPAVDFARLLRDFGPAFLAAALDAYGGSDDASDDALPRIWFYARCAAIDDLEFARTTGRTAYRDNALRSLAWLFPDR